MENIKSFVPFMVCMVILLFVIFYSSGCTPENAMSETDNLQLTAQSDICDLTGGITVKETDLNRDQLINISEQHSDSTSEWYVNDEGTEFLFDKVSGAYEGFIKTNAYKGAKTPQMYNKTELRQIADYAASCIVNISEYSDVTYVFQEDTGVHKFTYTKTLSGIPTADAGRVFITQDGIVEFLLFKEAGKYDGLDAPIIDIAKADSVLADIISSKDAEQIDSYNIQSRILDFEDNQWIIHYGCECKNADGKNTFEYFKIGID